MFTADYNAVTGYEEFRIELLYDAHREAFSLRVSSPAGQIDIPHFRPPMSRWEIEEVLAGVTRANTGTYFLRSAQSPVADTLRAMGSRLFDSIGENRVANLLYYQSCAKAREAGKSIRIRLVMRQPDMVSLPWEFLFDPACQDFMALSTLSPVVRQWQWPALPSDSLPVEPPLRVLAIVAEVNQWDSGAEAELALLADMATTGMGLELEVVSNATPRKFCDALEKPSYHVLHLILSAAKFGLLQDWGPNTIPDIPSLPGQSLLLFADDTDIARPTQATELSIPVLRNALSQQQGLQFVCFSGDCTDWLASQVTSHSPATLGWRGTNTLEAYLSFTRGFYSALVNGQPLEAAVTYGRKAIDAEYPGSQEWGMPVFYLQTPQGFRLQPQRKASYEAPAHGGRLHEPPTNPALQREWKKWRTLLTIAEQNYQSLQDEVGKYSMDTIPEYVSNQLQELQEKIGDLVSKLEQL